VARAARVLCAEEVDLMRLASLALAALALCVPARAQEVATEDSDSGGSIPLADAIEMAAGGGVDVVIDSSVVEQVPRARCVQLSSADALARVDGLLGRILAQARAREVDEVRVSFRSLGELIRDGGLPLIRATRGRVAALAPELATLGEVGLALALQLDLAEGNHLLRGMADALRRDDPASVAPGLRDVEELVARMQLEGGPVLRRNADALLLRGRALAARAAVLERFLRLPLAITAIVVGGPDAGAPDAAIVNGWIVAEGEHPRDAAGAELAGVTVVDIDRGTVRLRFEDTELVRELGR
jgi:hypothetical protein